MKKFQRSEGTTHPTPASAREQKKARAKAHRALSSTSAPQGQGESGRRKDEEKSKETSRYEWVDFFSSSRFILVAIVGIQSQTSPIE